MNYSKVMAPNHHFMVNSLPMEPVSRTYQYRKIMKPMLERKRRARINKCLDELKDLMTGTLQSDGENVSKLEKADILELTVRHLQRLREHNALFLHKNDTMNMEKFWAGFQHCAAEVSQFLNKYDQSICCDLIKHIAGYIPNAPPVATPTTTAAKVKVAPLCLPSTAPTVSTNVAHYQRFHATMSKVSTVTATATMHATQLRSVLDVAQNKIYEATGGVSSTTASLVVRENATNKARYHPYAASVNDAGGEGGGGVWRPW